MDDISPLRNIPNQISKETEGKLLATRPAQWYAQRQGMYAQGDNEYKAENPDYGATFTYFLREGLTDSAKKARTQSEKKLIKAGRDIPFPGWDELDAESAKESGGMYLTIRDVQGTVLKRVKASSSKGMNRTTWDLSMSSNRPINIERSGRGGRGGFRGGNGGYQVTPGTYNVTLSKIDQGEETILDGPMDFKVVPLMEASIKGASYDEIATFRSQFEGFSNDLRKTSRSLDKSEKLVDAMSTAFSRADQQPYELLSDINELKESLRLIDLQMNGNKSKNTVGEKNNPTPGDANLLGWVALNGTYGPTGNHKKAFNRAVGQLTSIQADLDKVVNLLPGIRQRLSDIGAPEIEE